ncbi:MAG: c-type cytochrome [Gemmatimonadota bacterium]|nr:c-type cytochrome [Gemmatimonadota bacterium]
MWRTNLAVAFVVLGTLGVYTAVANMIPQVQSDVPEELVLSADVSPEELVAAGEILFAGSGGGCTACHGLGTRAPDLLGSVGSTCETREPGKSCKDYLHESLVDPGAYVVEGFQPIMPDMSRTLSDAQIWSLVAFLQSQGGEVTVTAADLAPSGDGPDATTPTDPATDGRATPQDIDPAALIQSLGCTACHAYGASPGGVGPAISAMAGLEPDYLRRSIVEPAADTAAGFEALAGTMPPTFGQQLTDAQLEALVTYLASGVE